MRYAGIGSVGAVVTGSILTVACCLLYGTVPVLGTLAGIIAPLPALYSADKFGRFAGILIVVITSATLVLIDPEIFLHYLVLGVTISLAVPHLDRKGIATGRILGYTAMINAAILVVLVAVSYVMFHIDIDAQIKNGIHQSFVEFEKAYRNNPSFVTEDGRLAIMLRQMEAFIAKIYPALILVFIGFLAWVNLFVFRLMASGSVTEGSSGRFYNYRNPDVLVWLLIVASFVLVFGGSSLNRAALNVLTVVYCLYLLQGIAVVVWKLRKNTYSRVLQTVFYLLLLLQPIITSAIVAVIGLFDLWVDFRAPRKLSNL